MRYASIRKMDVSNGVGIGVALFTQGCHIHCHNCFNKDLWEFTGGKPFTKSETDLIIDLLKKKSIHRFSVLGGEPLSKENISDLLELLKKVKSVYPDKEVWLYTGYFFEQVFRDYRELFDYIDYLVDSPYVDELRDLKLMFRGSSNQRVIDVKKSIDYGYAVEDYHYVNEVLEDK